VWGPLTPINESPSRKEFNAQLHRASLGRILPVSVGKLQRRVLLRDFELPEHFPMHRVSGWTILRVVSIEQLLFMHLLQQRLLLPQWCGLPAPASLLLFRHGVLNSCPRPTPCILGRCPRAPNNSFLSTQVQHQERHVREDIIVLAASERLYGVLFVYVAQTSAILCACTLWVRSLGSSTYTACPAGYFCPSGQ
jgi:hypothetical protein